MTSTDAIIPTEPVSREAIKKRLSIMSQGFPFCLREAKRVPVHQQTDLRRYGFGDRGYRMSNDNEMSRILDEIGRKPMLTASVVLF
jgi:hypothetical protein